MSRVQLALNVSDLDAAVDFYSQLFATSPAKRRQGYANFAIADPPLKLVLFENPSEKGKLNHLGIEVDSSDKVAQTSTRLKQAELTVKAQNQTTCCYAKQDKVWVTDPDGDDWEVYVVLEDSAKFACEGTRTTASTCS
ncbi:MAG: ArsI/CadI family heavy metal resistance metalloenzyme [Xenococcaceae cyanobacterium]